MLEVLTQPPSGIYWVSYRSSHETELYTITEWEGRSYSLKVVWDVGCINL